MLHLLHIGGSRRIQRLLSHRLFATALSSYTALQGRVRAQECIDLDKALGTTQQSQQNIDQLILWAIFDGLLFDVDP